MKKIIVAISFASFLISCGPNAQEQAAIQQRHDDSIRMVTAAEVVQTNNTRIEAENKKIEAENKKKELQAQITEEHNKLQQQLVDDNAQMAVLVDRKKHDAEFHIGRLQSTREETVRKDQLEIDNLKIEMNNIHDKMEQLKKQASN